MTGSISTAPRRRTAIFAPLSAQLDAESIQILAAAAKLVPKLATQVKVRAAGYVQPSALHGNDISLSTMRARVDITISFTATG